MELKIFDRPHPRCKKIEYIIVDNDCWECTSHYIRTSLYPAIKVNGKNLLLHRVIYLFFNGTLIGKEVVRHTCDNNKCINPDHLIKGSQADNVQDAVARGRTTKGYPGVPGERNPMAKVNDTIVKEIRSSNLSRKDLRARFNISKSTINRIINRETWRHV